MPIYEYECKDCGETTESLRAMRDADAAIACERCGSERTGRKQSLVAAGPGGGDAVPELPDGACGTCGDPRGPGACAM